MKLEKYLWTEKYRPQTIEDTVIPSFLKEEIQGGELMNYLLYGSPGSGKTSTAKAIVKQFGLPYIYINASKETSVDIVRTRITEFCSTRSIMDDPTKMKVVILDEIDGASQQFFKAFKASMEEFHANSRFIATSNFINKIDDAIKSRFKCINFDFAKEEESELLKGYVKRLYEICKQEDLKIENEALIELVKRRFPDFRSMLNTLQGFKIEGKELVKAEDVRKFASVFKDVFELIFKNVDPVVNYQYMMSNYSNRVDDVLSALGNEFIEYIIKEKPDKIKYIPQIIIEVNKYQSTRQDVIDPTISMLACVYSLQSIVNNA